MIALVTLELVAISILVVHGSLLIVDRPFLSPILSISSYSTFPGGTEGQTHFYMGYTVNLDCVVKAAAQESITSLNAASNSTIFASHNNTG